MPYRTRCPPVRFSRMSGPSASSGTAAPTTFSPCGHSSPHRSCPPSRRVWAPAFVYASANWLWDCLALALSFAAVGAGVPWRGLLLAYGAAQLAINLPITPGGLGVVEGSLTIALVAYGGQQASTVATVVLYRLISFWGLLGVGWVSWAGLAWAARRAEREAVP